MPDFKKYLKKYFRTSRPSKQQFYYYFFQDIKRIPQNVWLLDIAAAKCKGYDIFNDFKYVAADISLDALKHPNCFQPNIERVMTDILNPGFIKESFGAVICTHTLSHLKPEQRMKAIDNIARLVKPGGILIFNVQLKNRGEALMKFKAVKNHLLQDFVIHRAIKYNGLLTRAYEKTVVRFFQRVQVESVFLYRARLLIAFFIFGFEYITQLYRVYSRMAYFCLEKKAANSLKDNEIIFEDSDIIDKLACPKDLGALFYTNNGMLMCKQCGAVYLIKGIDKWPIFCIIN